VLGSVGGVKLTNLVTWGRLPDECLMAHRNWDGLLTYLRQGGSLEHVGADWLVVTAAGQVLGRKILVYSSCFDVAVRFVAEDAQPGGFLSPAHLSPGASWIRLAILEGQYFVALEPTKLRAESLKSKLESMTAVMDKQITLCVDSLAPHLDALLLSCLPSPHKRVRIFCRRPSGLRVEHLR
jgi:hypothetical protein